MGVTFWIGGGFGDIYPPSRSVYVALKLGIFGLVVAAVSDEDAEDWFEPA